MQQLQLNQRRIPAQAIINEVNQHQQASSENHDPLLETYTPTIIRDVNNNNKDPYINNKNGVGVYVTYNEGQIQKKIIINNNS